MPPVKKEQAASPSVEELQAELAAMREQLAQAQAQPVDTNDRIAQALELLAANQQASAQPREREAGMMEMGSGVLQEQDALQAIPLTGPELDHEKVYIAKGRNLTIVKVPRRAMQDSEGNTWVRPGQHISFAPDGYYRTRNPDVIAFLESRPSFGREFWDADNIPGAAPAPDVALERILQYATDLNLPGLNEMEIEERSGTNRQLVMTAIKKAQQQVQIARADLEKQKQEVS